MVTGRWVQLHDEPGLPSPAIRAQEAPALPPAAPAHAAGERQGCRTAHLGLVHLTQPQQPPTLQRDPETLQNPQVPSESPRFHMLCSQYCPVGPWFLFNQPLGPAETFFFWRPQGTRGYISWKSSTSRPLWAHGTAASVLDHGSGGSPPPSRPAGTHRSPARRAWTLTRDT